MDIDLAAIRRIAEAGLPVMPATVLALIERLELAEHNLAYAMSALQRVDTERLALLAKELIDDKDP